MSREQAIADAVSLIKQEFDNCIDMPPEFKWEPTSAPVECVVPGLMMTLDGSTNKVVSDTYVSGAICREYNILIFKHGTIYYGFASWGKHDALLPDAPIKCMENCVHMAIAVIVSNALKLVWHGSALLNWCGEGKLCLPKTS